MTSSFSGSVGWRWMTSAPILTSARGVFSSWEASATKARWRRNESLTGRFARGDINSPPHASQEQAREPHRHQDGEELLHRLLDDPPRLRGLHHGYHAAGLPPDGNAHDPHLALRPVHGLGPRPPLLLGLAGLLPGGEAQGRVRKARVRYRSVDARLARAGRRVLRRDDEGDDGGFRVGIGMVSSVVTVVSEP